ncbi:hypothetical protein BC828DRAFT_271725 [Blastocladiella britannica]|nr:hypothetical protein BC828DRAFT_271725 [Blastocladiella britannica]
MLNLAWILKVTASSWNTEELDRLDLMVPAIVLLSKSTDFETSVEAATGLRNLAAVKNAAIARRVLDLGGTDAAVALSIRALDSDWTHPNKKSITKQIAMALALLTTNNPDQCECAFKAGLLSVLPRLLALSDAIEIMSTLANLLILGTESQVLEVLTPTTLSAITSRIIGTRYRRQAIRSKCVHVLLVAATKGRDTNSHPIMSALYEGGLVRSIVAMLDTDYLDTDGVHACNALEAVLQYEQDHPETSPGFRAALDALIDADGGEFPGALTSAAERDSTVEALVAKFSLMSHDDDDDDELPSPSRPTAISFAVPTDLSLPPHAAE